MTHLFSRLARSYRRAQQARRLRALRRSRIGAGSHVASTVQVYGWKNVEIGRDTILCEETLINAVNRETTDITLSIGDHCFIGRRNYFTTGSQIRVRDYCLTTNDCQFLGADRDIRSPFVPYLVSGALTDCAIVLGPNCWLGQGATLLKGVGIGYGSVIGARTVVTANVPPLSIVVGHPGRIVKRFCPRREAWVRAEDFTAEDEAALQPEEEYLAQLRRTHPALRGPLVGSSRAFGDF